MLINVLFNKKFLLVFLLNFYRIHRKLDIHDNTAVAKNVVCMSAQLEYAKPAIPATTLNTL